MKLSISRGDPKVAHMDYVARLDTLWFKHDLAVRVALLELSIGIANLGQRIDLGNRDLKTPGSQQAREFPEDLRISGRVVTFRHHTILSRGGEVDDRVDTVRRDAQLECQLHIPPAEGVDKGIDFSSGCSADPILNTISIGNRNYAMIAEPLMIRSAGQADNFGACLPGQLHRDRPDSARGAGDNDSITRLQGDAPHRGVFCGAGHEEGTGLFPRYLCRTGHKVSRVDDHQLSLA